MAAVVAVATFHTELPFIPDTFVVCPPAMLKVSDPMLHTSFQMEQILSKFERTILHVHTISYTTVHENTRRHTIFVLKKRRNKHLIFTSLHVNAGFLNMNLEINKIDQL